MATSFFYATTSFSPTAAPLSLLPPPLLPHCFSLPRCHSSVCNHHLFDAARVSLSVASFFSSLSSPLLRCYHFSLLPLSSLPLLFFSAAVTFSAAFLLFFATASSPLPPLLSLVPLSSPLLFLSPLPLSSLLSAASFFSAAILLSPLLSPLPPLPTF